MHKKTNKIIAGAMSLIMAAASTISTAATAQTEPVQVLGESTFEEKILPWHICQASPARQEFDMEDGTMHIRIIVPEGADKEKWDLQFRHRNLNFKRGHEYKVSFKAKSSRNGFELTSKIGTIKGDEEYFELDGQTNDMHMGPHMGGQWPSAAVKLTPEWQTYEGTFIPTKDLEEVEWCFQYAKGCQYQGNAQEGDEIWFDDMSIECLTCLETPYLTDCGWPYCGEYGISPRNDVRINQMGYYTTADKKATYATSEEKKSMNFKVINKDGNTVYNGKTEPAGFDEAAGEYCQIIDFSDVKASGTYTIVVDDQQNSMRNTSHEFRIGDDIYDGVLKNALNYYYQNRSGMEIDSTYITSGDKAKLAHEDILKKDMAYVQTNLKRNYDYVSLGITENDLLLDMSGGWYDAENYEKSITNGGTALWLLQNMYEMSKKNGTDIKWTDGNAMTVPNTFKSSKGNEINCAGTPDLLDEARYELEFMFRMIVDPEIDTVCGENYANFVYNKVKAAVPYPSPYIPLNYISDTNYPRIVCPPTYDATFTMIACAAQAARLWKGIDDEFAMECLDRAEKSWEAVMKRQEEVKNEDPEEYVPWCDLCIDHSNVDDEAYWAACELFATTGENTYYDYLSNYKGLEAYDQCQAFGVPYIIPSEQSCDVFTSIDRNFKVSCGTLSLYLSDKTSEKDKDKIKNSLKTAADKFIECEDDFKNGGMGIPYKEVKYDYMPGTLYDINTPGYDYGSNSRMTGNSITMAYAYDSTGDSKYLNGALQSMDYIFGRNGMGFSYVTGCGTYHAKYPVHEYWINEIDSRYPMAPDGVMVGGPFSYDYDNYMKLLGYKAEKTPPQKFYTDSIEAWSVNTPALDWQAGFAWNIAFFDDVLGKNDVAVVTTTTTSTGTTTTTTTTRNISDTTTTTSATTTTTTIDTTATTSQTITNDETVYYGDANCDGTIDMSDAVLIMQALANPNKYGIEGSDKHALTEEGKKNADVEGQNGLTTQDALTIQKYLLKLVDSLPLYAKN